MRLLTPLALAVLPTLLAAQTVTTIPAGFANKEGNSSHWSISKYGPSRTQAIYNASLLKGMPKVISKISFRKDGAYKSTTVAAPKHVFFHTVYLASKGVPNADNNSWLLSENKGSNFTMAMPKTKISWPQMTNPGTNLPEKFNVTFPFPKPIPYLGGNLLIQVDTDTVSGKYESYNRWEIDAESYSTSGGTAGAITFPSGKIGCNGTNGAYASHYASPASYSARPGAKMRLYMWRISLKAKAAVSFLGTPLKTSVKLDGLGMKGCQLHINPIVMVPMSLGYPSGTSATSYNRAFGHVAIPNEAKFVGVTVAMQALIADPGANAANLVMSNMSTVKIGSQLPKGGLRQAQMIYYYSSVFGQAVLKWDHMGFYTSRAPIVKIN